GWLPGRGAALPTCEVTNTRLPQTTGVETPIPRSGACHATFCVSLQVTGRFFSGEIPASPGPRHAGQLSADSAAPVMSVRSRTAAVRIMRTLLRVDQR